MASVMEAIRYFTSQKKPEVNRVLPIIDNMNAMQKKREHIASNPAFNAVIVLSIIINTITIGLEVDNGKGQNLEDRTGYFAAEFVFSMLFCLELVLRVNQNGWDFFEDTWNIFDYSLVMLSISDVTTTLSMPNHDGLPISSSLRIFRLLRVVRSIKGLKAVSGLWIILAGLLDSIRTVFWVTCQCIIFVYMFAVALTTVIGHDAETAQKWSKAEIYVGSVSKSMLTILQVVTLDSWTSDIARPMATVAPVSVIVVLCAIFVLSFGTLNIMVAVMVQRITAIAQDSKESASKVLERTEHALLQSILEEFHQNDKDGSGTLEVKEFKKLIRLPSLNSKLGLMGIRVDEAESLFELMDADKSGSITPNEFISGLLKVKGFAKGQDVVQLIVFSQKQCLRANRFVTQIQMMSEKVDQIQSRMTGVGKQLSAEMGQRRDAEGRGAKTLSQAVQRGQVIAVLDDARRYAFPDLDHGHGDGGSNLLE